MLATRAHGARLRDRLVRALRETEQRILSGRVVPLRLHRAQAISRFFDRVLLTEDVHIFFTKAANAQGGVGMPLTMAVDMACARLMEATGETILEVLDNEVRVCLVALQMLDAAIERCVPFSREPRIESITTRDIETVGLRLQRDDTSFLVTPGEFIHPNYNFMVSEAIRHPGSWFCMPEAEIDEELFN